MVDEIRFDFTIHHSENFEWNPGLEYVGGEVSDRILNLCLSPVRP